MLLRPCPSPRLHLDRQPLFLLGQCPESLEMDFNWNSLWCARETNHTEEARKRAQASSEATRRGAVRRLGGAARRRTRRLYPADEVLHRAAPCRRRERRGGERQRDRALAPRDELLQGCQTRSRKRPAAGRTVAYLRRDAQDSPPKAYKYTSSGATDAHLAQRGAGARLPFTRAHVGKAGKAGQAKGDGAFNCFF